MSNTPHGKIEWLPQSIKENENLIISFLNKNNIIALMCIHACLLRMSFSMWQIIKEIDMIRGKEIKDNQESQQRERETKKTGNFF